MLNIIAFCIKLIFEELCSLFVSLDDFADTMLMFCHFAFVLVFVSSYSPMLVQSVFGFVLCYTSYRVGGMA